MKKAGPRRAILYTRVSTLEQTAALQRDEGRAYIARRGLKLHALIQDKVSGARDRRKGLDRVRKLAMTKRFDILIVWRCDRLFRSLREMVNFVTLLREQGIDFKSLTEDFDTQTSSGRLLFHLISAMAQFERDIISERTSAGMAAAKRRGARFGRAPKRLDVAEIKRRIRAGEEMTKIATDLETTRWTVLRAISRVDAAALTA